MNVKFQSGERDRAFGSSRRILLLQTRSSTAHPDFSTAFSPTCSVIQLDRKLFLFYNGTGSPSQQQWVVPVLKTIFSARGSQQKPIKNVSIRGIGNHPLCSVDPSQLHHLIVNHYTGFRDAAYDYMDEWGVPSGGDWALHRGGYTLYLFFGTDL